MELQSFESKDALLGACRSFVVYGAGNTGRAVVTMLRRNGAHVAAVLDRRAAPGMEVSGVPVLAPGSAEARAALASPEAAAVVAVFNRGADTAEIGRTLADSGCRRLVTFFALYDVLADELGWRYWVAPRAYVAAHAHRVAWLRERLCDARSQATLDLLVAQRRSASLDFPRPEPMGEQYAPPDIPALASSAHLAHLVDCGAFDGDTLERLRGRFPPGAIASCFEPDPASFVKLAQRTRSAPAGDPATVLLWPCAVWDCTTQLQFSSGEGEASHIGASGGATVQTVSIDEALAGAPPPTMIKMDVEGAEPEALVGSHRTIERHRPVLAVCLYHRPAHLWQIAETIVGWDLGYELYLRTYAHQGFETVLYALPRAGLGGARK